MTKIVHQNAVPVFRYPEFLPLSSGLDHFDDLSNLIESLASKDLLSDIIRARHPHLKAMKPGDYAARCQPYIKAALQYLDQTMSGPRDISFLPAYYATLQLLKVYIILSHNSAELESQRWHGVTYAGKGRPNRSLFSEEVCIKLRGAIPLWYATVTGNCLARNYRISLGDIVPYLPGVGAEYSFATGSPIRLAQLALAHPLTDRGPVTLKFQAPIGTTSLRKRELTEVRII